MKQVSVAPGATLVNRIVPKLELEDLLPPSSVADVPRWLRDAGPFLKLLGGHPDDALDPETLKALEFAKITRDVNLRTRQYRDRNWWNLWDGLRVLLIANSVGARHLHCRLFNEAYENDEEHPWLEKTLCGMKIVTDAGVAQIVSGFRNTFEIELFNFHGVGTGGGAEAVGNTTLTTELTTALAPDNTRATGTQSAPSAPVYQTLGTTTYDTSQAITEHGIFSQAATGGGTLWDKTLFSVINATSIQHTHQTTVPSGG